MNVERLRFLRKFNIPMHEEMPKEFPISTLAVQRALCAMSLEQPESVPIVVDVLYHEFFVNHQMLNKPDVVVALIAKALKISQEDAKTIYAKGSSPEAKALLLKNTKVAFDEGAFGLPWFVGMVFARYARCKANFCLATNAKGEKESFWGFDHLGLVVDHLDLERSQAGEWKMML